MDAGEKLQDVSTEIDELIKTLDALLSENDKAISDEIATVYPEFRPENYARAPKADDSRYEKLDPHNTPIRKNDVVTASTSTVMVAGLGLEEISKSLETVLLPASAPERINEYLNVVHSMVPHLYNKLSLEKELKERCSKVYENMVANKIIPLGNIFTGYTPATCFGQSIGLAFLINNDSSLFSQGFRAYVTVGDVEREDKTKGYHAWVKLYCRDGATERPIKLMDATSGKILDLDKDGQIISSDESTKGLYKEIDRSSFYILRKKNT